MDKETFAIVGIILTIIGYLPYITDTVKGKTTPHLYSWLVWSVLGLTNSALFFQNGGGNGSYVHLTSTLITIFIFILSIFKGHKEITRSDKIFLTLSIVAFTLWFFIDQPGFAAIFATSTSLLALGPTIRKSWTHPHSETLSTYIMNTIRHTLVILALDKYSLITLFNPIMWSFVNFGISLILIFRRKK